MISPIKLRFVFSQSALNIALAVVYALFYHFIYENFAYYWFSYANLSLYKSTSFSWFAYVIQASLPVVFFKGFRNFSCGISFFVYLLVYVPFINTLYIMGLPNSLQVSYGLVFFISMCAFFLSDNTVIGRNFLNRIRPFISFRFFEFFVWLVFVLVVLMNISSMHYVNIFSEKEAMYELRSEYHVSNAGSLVLYIVSWLGHSFIPILLVCYLQQKKYLKASFAVISFLFLFMISMQKITIVIPFIILALFFVYKSKPSIFSKHFFAFFVLGLSVVSFVLYYFSSNPAVFSLAVLLIMRTQCIEGMELDRYLSYFELTHHPVTHYSHIGLINLFTRSYPYPESIGRMVAGDGSNSNGTFWLMDGVAADGVIGCIIISVVFVFVKAWLNSLSSKYDNGLLLIVFLYSISAMMNTSLFTSLLTSGFIVSYLVLLLVDLSPLKKN